MRWGGRSHKFHAPLLFRRYHQHRFSKIKFTADSAVVNVVVSFHFFRTSFQETQPGVARTRNELELS